MNKLVDFIRTTLIGGLLYLIPIVVLMMVLGKAFGVAHKLVPGLVDLAQKAQLGHIFTPTVFAILLVVAFCFLAGLFSRTRVARSIAGFIDSKILINIPGYGFFAA